MTGVVRVVAALGAGRAARIRVETAAHDADPHTVGPAVQGVAVVARVVDAVALAALEAGETGALFHADAAAIRPAVLLSLIHI